MTVTAATDITAHFSGARRYAPQKGVRAADLGTVDALGAAVVSGVDSVARSVNLAPRIARSSLVITGEGRFDEGSLEGKVVVGVAELVQALVPLLVVCGSFNDAAARTFRRQFANARIFSLEHRFGLDRALDEVRVCVDAVVREEVPRFLGSSLA